MKFFYSILFFCVLAQSINANLSSESIELTQEEKEYILKNSPVSLCIQYEQLPIDGYVNNKHIGIMSDVFHEITNYSNLEFNVVVSNSRDELKQNVDDVVCDILSVYATNNSRYKTLKATKPFTQTHFTLISKLDKSFISGTHLLYNKILVTQFPIYKQYLDYLYPSLTVQVITDKTKMVEAVLKGEAYAVITIDEQADYIIDKYGYGKLKINGFLAKERALNASIGVQKDKSILYSIIEKSLQSISSEKINNIINSWRLTRYKNVENYTLVFSILGLMSLFLFILIYYQRKLTNFNRELEKQVHEKTRALTEINEYLEGTVSEKVDELTYKDKIMTVQSKQAVMGEMISMVAHQWRQPINTITLQISNLQLKQMMGKKVDCSEFVPALDEISQTLGYLSETIDDFKTYFHPQKKTSLVYIDELLSKAINFVQAHAKVHNIQINITHALNLEVDVYQNELIQVLLNILNNAIDAYENIQSSEKTIQIYALDKEDEIWIFIEDNAGGIKKKHLQQIFEPYFSTKGKNGTGLGLYMSQMIIEKQFLGKIEVHSKGTQTHFMIKLPKVHRV